MRVAIDTTYARRAPLSGTGIYIERLCHELRAREDVELVELFNRRRRPPAGGGVGSVRNLASDIWWTRVELPRRASEQRAELIHHPLPARCAASIPEVITVVDLAFERLPEHFDRRFQMYASRTHRAAARAAAAVICISETTATDASEIWGVPRERITVAPLGPGQVLPMLREAGSASAQPRHFLYVGDSEPRKNLPVLLAAYRQYRASAAEPLELVLAGSAAASQPGVRAIAGPGSAELATLYREAVALVHPSLFEGFGLTALEAMDVGTPVLAARSPGVIEVCADAARYVAPDDPGAFAQAMAELAQDASARTLLAERGRTRAAEFSWARCAEKHVEAYARVCASWSARR